MNIDDILNKIISNGSRIELETLKKIKTELLEVVNKDYSLEEIVNFISNKLKEKTEEFLYNDEIIAGISTSVFLNPNYEINIIGGSKSREEFDKIDEQSLFDVASITKLYTGLLVMKLNELKLLNLDDKIDSITKQFNLNDYAISDLAHMRGIIMTSKRLDECKSSIEAFEILKSIHVENNDKELYNYTDMGLIVLVYILEELLGMDYNKIIHKYLLDPMALKATYFPDSKVVGNGRTDNLVNDPKANILNRPVGSAGLFTNSSDLILLSKKIFNNDYLPQETIKQFCFNRTAKPKGIFGSYTHHPLGMKKTYVPNEYSYLSFAYEGFTGSVAVFDLINQLHNNILVNALYENTLLKHPLFSKTFGLYQTEVTETSLKLLIIDKMFEDKNSFVKKIKI